LRCSAPGRGQLIQAIDATPDRAQLKEQVDELDLLEPDLTAYDTLRFGGPVSRETHITAVRERLS
jgi:hypothetical protein